MEEDFEYGDQFADYMQYESEFLEGPNMSTAASVRQSPHRRRAKVVDEDYEPDYHSEVSDEDHSDHSDHSEEDDYEEGEVEEEEEEIGSNPEDYGDDERSKEQVQVDDEAMATAIMTSIQTVLPSLPESTVKPRIRMTDLGLRISQMVILKNTSSPVDYSDDVYGEGEDAFLEKTLSGNRRNRTGVRGRPKKVDFGFGKSTTVKLAPEVAKLMGQANMAFVQRHYDQSIQLLQEVIRQASGSHEPYHTLGLIYEETGQLDRAFSYFLLSAHLSKGDVELWNKLTMLAIRLGFGRETVYCLSKVLQMGRIRDPRPYWVRSRLYLELHSYHNVIWSLVEMLRRNFSSLEEWQAVARLALRINLTYDAAKIFFKLIDEALTGRIRGGAGVEWSHLNLLLEMNMATKNWEGLVGAVERFAPPIYQSTRRNLTLRFSGEGLADVIPHVPLDIQVKMAIALVAQRMPPGMLPYGLDRLLGRLDGEDYGDLRLTLGDAFAEASHHQPALLAYIPLLHHPLYGDAGLCLKIGKAHAELGNHEDAIGVLSIACQLEPDRSDIRVALAQAYKSVGQLDIATQILGDQPDASDLGKMDKMEVDLDPASIFSKVYGPTDLSLLYGVDPIQGAIVGEISEGASTGILMADRIASLLKLPNIKSDRPHPALRRIRRRSRKIIQVMYTPDQISAVRSDHSSCLIYYSQLLASTSTDELDYLAADNFLRLAAPLLEDDLPTNSHICAVDEEIKYRGAAPEIQKDLAALHGLYLDEWYGLLEMHCIVLALIGTPEKAIRLLRPLFTQSAFCRDPAQAARMRLLQLALAQRANRQLGALIGSRWFLTHHPNKLASTFIYTLMSYNLAPDVIALNLNTRMLVRIAAIDPTNRAAVLVAGHNAFARQSYEEAIRLYTVLLSSTEDDVPWIAAARIKHQLSVCLIESSFKRTCLSPKLGFTQGFGLIATNRSESPPEHRAEMTYNLARVCHECGLVRKAEPLYREVLGMEGKFGRDAAFNLHLIYLQSGNHQMARSILSTRINI